MSIEQGARVAMIAKVCHEANRAYCEALGDYSQLEWEHRSNADIRRSVIAGVCFRIDRPAATPEDQHEAWRRFKKSDGWVHGPIKDAEKLTHPNLVPYPDLPEAERRKDSLFAAIVDALL